MKRFFIFGLALSFCAMACERADIDLPTEANLRDLSYEEVELARSSTGFALELFHQLNDEKLINQFFSPFSIHQALSMAMNGNEGEVLAEFRKVLHNEDLPLEELNKAARDLSDLLQKMDAKVNLSIANGIWVNDQYEIQVPFRNTAQDYYQAEAASLDMSNPQSVEIINDWIARKTNNLIIDMLDEVSQDALMYLVNAIYFKADWKYTFDAKNTKEAPFYTLTGEEVPAKMMDMKEPATFHSYYSENLHYLEIPYSTGQFQMSIIYNPSGDLAQAVAQLNMANLKTWRENSREANFILKMPKFKMKQKMENMDKDLMAMGLRKPFQSHRDNFTKLVTSGLHEERKISKVIHEAVIEVDEKGSEAAAATVVEVIKLTSLPTEIEPRELVLDKPFVFIIQEKHSGTILFMGKLGDPSILQ